MEHIKKYLCCGSKGKPMAFDKSGKLFCNKPLLVKIGTTQSDSAMAIKNEYIIGPLKKKKKKKREKIDI